MRVNVNIFYKIVLGLLVFFNLSFADDVVADTNGLSWENSADTYYNTWNDAISYCEEITLDGYNNWRVPNINELISIVDYNRSSPAVVDKFTNTNSEVYWSATTKKVDSNTSLVVDFDDGYIGNFPKTVKLFVRCVRNTH